MTQQESGPAPSDPIERLFWSWYSLDNGHPFDDNRFYDAVVQATLKKPHWDRAYVREMFLRFGMSQAKAEQRSRYFWIGRCALIKKEDLEKGNDRVVF
jgi:hypothetical protein